MADMTDGPWWALAGAAVGKAIDAGVKLVGSRRERDRAEKQIDDANERAAEIALRIAGEEREETTRVRAQRDLAFSERDTCQQALRKMDSRLSRSEARQSELAVAHRDCTAVAAKQAVKIGEQDAQLHAQREQIDWMESAIVALNEGKPLPPRKSTPPPGMMPKPEEVAKGVAALNKEP